MRKKPKAYKHRLEGLCILKSKKKSVNVKLAKGSNIRQYIL